MAGMKKTGPNLSRLSGLSRCVHYDGHLCGADNLLHVHVESERIDNEFNAV